MTAVTALLAVVGPSQAFSTPIDDKYAALGGTGSFLGAPTDIERPTPGNGGSYRAYQHGSIHWSQASGAYETHGLIEQKWAQLGWEQGFLGFPTTDESETPDHIGRYNHFQGGAIYWTPALGAHEVHGYILQKWASLGWERSSLGYPISDEETRANPPGRVSRFEHGRIEWSSQEGSRVFPTQAIKPIKGFIPKGGKVTPVAGGKTTLVTGGTAAGTVLGKVVGGNAGGVTLGMMLGAARVQQFQHAATPNTPLFLVNPLGAATKVAPSAAGIQLKRGEFLVATTKEQVSRTPGNTRFLLPTRALTANESGETFDLQPALELASPGLQISEDGTKYTAQILLGFDDAEKPSTARVLPDPIWMLPSSNAVNVNPVQVSITHTNLPYEVVLVSGDPASDSVEIDLKIPSFKVPSSAPTSVKIQVIRPGVRLGGPHAVEGLGAGTIKLSVSLAPGVGNKRRNISLSAEKGDVVPQTVDIAEGESKVVEYRPRLLGNDIVLASTANLADAKQGVQLVFPWMFLVAAFLGGGIGSVILRLLRPNRAATVLARYFLGGVLMGFLVACLYALGVNVTTIPVPIERSPLSIFVLGALGAIAAIPLVSKWSEEFKGILEGK